MIVLKTLNGRVAQCRSDDGLATARHTPSSLLSGEFELVDANGRPMWRGRFIDDKGHASEPVPSDVWASACRLMADWSAHQKAREDARAQARLDAHRADAEFMHDWESLSARMDDPNSDL